MKEKFTLDDVEEKLQSPKSWWAVLAVLPVVRRLSLVLANYTSITPNAVTSISLILAMSSVFFFLRGDYHSCIVGALLYYLSYVFDCVDGAIARLKRNGSTFGKIYDSYGDCFKTAFISFGLFYGQFRISFNVYYLLAGHMFTITMLLHYLRLYLREQIMPEYRKDEITVDDKPVSGSPVKKYFAFMSRHKLKAIPSGIEMLALVFVITPVVNPSWINYAALLAMAYLWLITFQQMVSYYRWSVDK